NTVLRGKPRKLWKTWAERHLFESRETVQGLRKRAGPGVCAIVVLGLPMSTLSSRFLSPEEYLEIERKAEDKSEYYKGEMFAMSGVSRRHDRIAVQLTFLFAQHLRGDRKSTRLNSSH